MNEGLTYSEFEDRLFIALINREDETGSLHHIDLGQACSSAGLPIREDWLVEFVNQQSVYGNGNAVAGYDFLLNNNGRFRARELREKYREKAVWEKAVALGPDWWTVGLSALSLVISIIALVRTT